MALRRAELGTPSGCGCGKVRLQESAGCGRGGHGGWTQTDDLRGLDRNTTTLELRDHRRGRRLAQPEEVHGELIPAARQLEYQRLHAP